MARFEHSMPHASPGDSEQVACKLASLDVDGDAMIAEAAQQLELASSKDDMAACIRAWEVVGKALQATSASIARQFGGGMPTDQNNGAAAANLQEACRMARLCADKLAPAISSAELGASLAQPLVLIAPATYELAALVLGSREACSLLLAAGGHADAVEDMQHAVKELSNQLPQLLAQQLGAAGDGSDSMCDGGEEDVWHWLQACAMHLTTLAVASASNVAAPASADMPSQLRSFSVLNTSWGSLIRLVSALPGSHRSAALSPQDMHRAVACGVEQLAGAVQQLSSQCDANRLRILKFWLQCVVKLVCARPQTAATQAWEQLLSLTLDLHQQAALARDKPSAEAYQQHLHELVLPRLMACLLAALSHGGLEPLELHMRLQDIMGADVVAGGMQEEAAGRLSLVMELLQRSSGMGALLAEQCAQTLLPWALRVACTACYGSMLRGSASALEGQLQHSCLSFLTGIAFAELQEAWRAALMQLFALALCAHPLVSHQARALLVMLLEEGGAQLLAEPLVLAAELLAAAAARDTLAANCPSEGTLGLLQLTASLLTAVPCECKSQAVQDVLASQQEGDDVSSVAAGALCWQAVLQAAPEAVPAQAAQQQLKRWTIQGQEVLAMCADGALSSEERSFAARHLAWLLEAVAVLGRSSNNSSGGLAQQPGTEAAALLAVDALHFADTSSDAVVQPIQEAALTAVAALGAALSSEALPNLLPVLERLPIGQCSLGAARVLAFMGTVEQQPEALFHQLLGSPCWAVQQAAMVSLVAYSRQHTGSITSLVPAGARTAAGNAVHPLFVQALASHMKQEPDAQATSTYQQAGETLQLDDGGGLRALAAQAAQCTPDAPTALAQAERCLQSHQAALQQLDQPHPGPAEGQAVPLAQVLAPLLQATTSGMSGVAQALGQLESSTQALAAAARQGASQARAEDVVLLQRHANTILGDLASTISRMRGLQDMVSCLRP